MASQLFIVCHDSTTEKLAVDLKFPASSVISLNSLLAQYPELREAMKDRSRIEFIFCLTPYVIRYILDNIDINEVVYIDADKLILGNPEELFLSENESSFAITSHNFLPELENLSEFGRYNVGVVYARRSEESRKLLDWWSKKCIESTSIDGVNSEVFGDQKYLNNFHEVYPEVTVYENPGINSAPWNCADVYRRKDLLYRLDGNQVVTFHFSGLIYNQIFLVAGYSRYEMRLPKTIRNSLYKPYVRQLVEVDKAIKSVTQKTRPNSFKRFLRGFLYKDLVIHIKLNMKKN